MNDPFQPESDGGGIRADIALLATLVAGMFMQGILFLAGVPVSPYPMWLSFCAISATLAWLDRKLFVVYILEAFVCLLLTAATFSYTGADVASCHFPMQDLLRNGWNPVYDSTIEQFADVTGEHTLASLHVLFMPRAVALCGALVGASTGLFAADSFLNYVLVLVLFQTACGFSRKYWENTPLVSALFAFSIVSTTKLAAMLSGYIDYVVYASAMAMAFSAALYLHKKQLADLVAFTLSLAVCCLAKPNGLAIGLFTMVCMMPFLRKDKRFMLSLGLAFALVVA